MTRQPVRVEIDGVPWQVTPMPPRKSLRVAFRLVRIFGAPLAGLFSGDGLELPGIVDGDGEPASVKFADIFRSEDARNALLARLFETLAETDPDQLDELIDLLLVEHVSVVQGNAFLPLVTAEAVDEAVPDFMTLLRLLQKALEISLLPTSADADTSES